MESSIHVSRTSSTRLTNLPNNRFMEFDRSLFPKTFEIMTALEIIGLIACILIGLPLAIVLLVALGFGLYMLYIGFTDGFGINATL